jgi:hypothetical protein
MLISVISLKDTMFKIGILNINPWKHEARILDRVTECETGIREFKPARCAINLSIVRHLKLIINYTNKINLVHTVRIKIIRTGDKEKSK